MIAVKRLKKIKQRQCLPGEWNGEGAYVKQKREPRPLELPPPQEKAVLCEMPGKRDDGKLWFEGDKKRGAGYAEERLWMDKHFAGICLSPAEDRLKPRDVRNGDKWLPFHTKENK